MISSDRPVAVTESGSVQGVAKDGVAAFRSIPFATSPIGDQRLAAPAPPLAWPGRRDATRPGPSVPQAASRLEAVWDAGCLTGTRTAARASTYGRRA
jgi:para-nitrobenzyl esterase